MKTEPRGVLKALLISVMGVLVFIGLIYFWPFETNTDKYINPEPAAIKLRETRENREAHRKMRPATFDNLRRLPEERIVQLPPVLDDTNSRIAIVKFMGELQRSADILGKIPKVPEWDSNAPFDEKKFDEWQAKVTVNNKAVVRGHDEAGKVSAAAWQDLEASFGDEKSSKLEAFKSWWRELEHSKLLERTTDLSDNARATAASALTKEQDKIRNNETVNHDQVVTDLSPFFGFEGEFDSYIRYSLSNIQPPGTKPQPRPPLQPLQ